MKTPLPDDMQAEQAAKKLDQVASTQRLDADAQTAVAEVITYLNQLADSTSLPAEKRTMPTGSVAPDKLRKIARTDHIDSNLHSTLPMQLELFNDQEG